MPLARGVAWRALFAVEDSPAERAGLRVGDRIDSVDGDPVVHLSGDELREQLVDEQASEVILSVTHRDGTSVDLAIQPRKLIDPTVRHVRLLDPQVGIGYISIQSFSQETSDEFDRAVAHLRDEGMHSLVIDHLKGEVKDRPVAVVGMGEIGRKTAKALEQSGWRVDRYNRTADRERGWLALSELQPRLAGYGSLVVCSSAPEPVIHAAMLQEVSGLTLIDLGSPSQVSSAVIGAPGIDYLGLDEMAETAPQRLQNDRFETLKVLVAAAAQDSVEQLAQNRFRTLTHRNQTQLQEIFDTELPAVLDHFVAELPDKKRRDFEHQLRRLFRQHASGLRHAIVALDAELGPPTLRLAEDQDESC